MTKKIAGHPSVERGVTGNTERKKKEVKKMWQNVKRNEFRARKKSGRARTNALNSMTPQGQALWCAEHIDNASGKSLIKAPAVGISEVKL